MLAFPMPRLLSPILERKSLHAPGGSLPVAVHESQTCFVAPLFSWSYKLLFPQALCFDKHLRCPPGVTPTVHSLSSRKKPSVLESATSTLFHKNTGGGQGLWLVSSKSASSQRDWQAHAEY